MKNILFVASESVPFIKTGGLADVVGSLPKNLNKEKYDVRVFIPKYSCMKEAQKEKLTFKDSFYMDHNYKSIYVGIMEAEVDGIKRRTLFTAKEELEITATKVGDKWHWGF